MLTVMGNLDEVARVERSEVASKRPRPRPSHRGLRTVHAQPMFQPELLEALDGRLDFPALPGCLPGCPTPTLPILRRPAHPIDNSPIFGPTTRLYAK